MEDITLNPEIFRWARETAGLTLEAGAEAIGLNSAYGQTAAERLGDLEAGRQDPSRSVLLRMSKAYRRSLLVFYLNAPPPKGDRGQDFRSAPGIQTRPYSPELDALLRDIKRRQSIAKSLLEDMEAEKVPFVGSATTKTEASILARRMAQQISFSLFVFREQRNVEAAFSYLRSQIETSGVFVMLLGNLGSYHTNISTDVFRGFALADPAAPMVIINDQDARAAWSFTALHELTHLWLGATGISDASADSAIEQFCNDVAGEILLPLEQLSDIGRVGPRLDVAVEQVSDFADARNLSRPMVSYKLFRSGRITRDLWKEMSNRFYSEWLANKRRQAALQRADDSGPNYYVVRRHRVGQAIMSLVRRSLAEGFITYTKAGQVLGVKPTNVDPLLYPSTRGAQ
jgi:Zn-dependent peptidase ImmA (M78 family)